MISIPTKTTGNQLTATEFNQLPDELEKLVNDASLTPSSGDLAQVSKSVTNATHASNFYTDSGAADAYVLSNVGSFSPPTAYQNGALYRFRAANANTGASTANIASLGAISIKKQDGTTDLAANDITTTRDTFLRYDSSGGGKLLLTQGGEVVDTLQYTTPTEKTISTGIITVDQTLHSVDTEGDAASDDLVTISGMSEGQVLILEIENTSREVVIKDTGNIDLHSTEFFLKNAGDRIAFIGDSSGNPVELWRNKSSGLVLLKEKSVEVTSPVAYVDITDLNQYKRYEIEILNYIPSTDNTELWMRISQDNGSTFKSGASDYETKYFQRQVAGSAADYESASTDKIVIDIWNGTGTGENFNTYMKVPDLSSTTLRKAFTWQGVGVNQDNTLTILDNASGNYKTDTNAIDALRFLSSSGNIASCEINVYGVLDG